MNEKVFFVIRMHFCAHMFFSFSFFSSRVECILGRCLCNAGRKFEYFMHKMQNHTQSQNIDMGLPFDLKRNLMKEKKIESLKERKKNEFCLWISKQADIDLLFDLLIVFSVFLFFFEKNQFKEEIYGKKRFSSDARHI